MSVNIVFHFSNKLINNSIITFATLKAKSKTFSLALLSKIQKCRELDLSTIQEKNLYQQESKTVQSQEVQAQDEEVCPEEVGGGQVRNWR